jgi:polygalacturonase
MLRMSRRAFIGAAAAAAAAPVTLARATAQTTDRVGWDHADAILRRIRAPRFPDREFPITSYGARPGASNDATSAIRDAIAACREAGGGRVRVPAGTFHTGPIHLASGVNLHLDDDATLAFATDPRAYLPVVLTRFEGVELMGYSPLIYAIDAHDVAITGRGTLDGQAGPDVWWPWKGGATSGPNQTAARTRLVEMAAAACPSNGACSARAAICGRTSSSRTAATTCSSRT